jgi:hypothetical protein
MSQLVTLKDVSLKANSRLQVESKGYEGAQDSRSGDLSVPRENDAVNKPTLGQETALKYRTVTP